MGLREVGLERAAVACVAGLSAAAVLLPVSARFGPWAVAGAGAACALGVVLLAPRLPEALRGISTRRRWLAGLWAIVSLLAAAELARRSSFMADWSHDWGSVIPERVTAGHQCMSAYVQAGDLARRGEPNPYDERFYPAFRGLHGAAQVDVDSPVDGLRDWLDDPFEYPPPFLVLPATALAVTNSFAQIRAVWYVLHAALLLGGAALLAWWIGGREGRIAAACLPLFAVALPTGLELQFGQFHGPAIALALAGMVAFESRRAPLGGFLLAAAILAKLTPAVLLVALLARRRWRDLAWTALGGVVLWAAAWALLGPEPFRAFFGYQLPRLASGAAFSFAERPETPAFVVSRNFSAYGLAAKLRALGVSGASPAVGQVISGGYTLLLLWLAFTAREGVTRLERAQRWLALLSLAALRSPVAPSAYVVVPSLWLLCLLAAEVRGRPWAAVGLAALWLGVMGPPPLPGTLEFVAGLASQGVVVALNLWVLLRVPAPVTPPDSAGVRLPPEPIPRPA
ncbi:MAG TPA: glycosyltransferase family 87 protein [Myxococcota bacterium]|nr:glycosyltransferase family 87 protein [Myxococcota bacterium]